MYGSNALYFYLKLHLAPNVKDRVCHRKKEKKEKKKKQTF